MEKWLELLAISGGDDGEELSVGEEGGCDWRRDGDDEAGGGVGEVA
jgi:hypothetical protein